MFRAAVQAVTGANSRTAVDILESGLDYVERTSEPGPDDDFLRMLTEIYQEHETTSNRYARWQSRGIDPATRSRVRSGALASSPAG